MRRIIAMCLFFVISALLMAQTGARGQNEDKVLWASKIVKQYLGIDNLKPVPLEYVDDIDTFKKIIFDYQFGDKADKAEGLFALSDEFGFSVHENYSMDELLEEYAYATFGIYDERNDKLYVITPGLFEALKEKRYSKCDIREEDSDYIKYQDWRRQNLSNIVLVHVAAYMAQDQAYGLDSLYRKFHNNDDATLALRSMSVGQGDIVREEYMKNELNVKNLFMPDTEKLHASLQSSPAHSGPVPMLRYSDNSYGDRWSIKDFAGIQGNLSEYFSILGEHCDEDLSYIWWMRNFPFIFGGRFMNKVRVEKGWKATGDVFKRCPLSSEQIINSEKYFDPAKEDLPTIIKLPSLDGVLDTNEWKYLDYNVVGQAFLYLICRTLQFDQENFCIEAMDGWDGDRYVVWNNADNDILLAAYTTWDSPEDSSEFFHFYDKAWSARGPYGGTRSTEENKIIISGRGTGMLVERRGNDVIVVEGPVTEDQMKNMAEVLWKSEKQEASYDICTMPESDFKDDYAGTKSE